MALYKCYVVFREDCSTGEKNIFVTTDHAHSVYDLQNVHDKVITYFEAPSRHEAIKMAVEWLTQETRSNILKCQSLM